MEEQRASRGLPLCCKLIGRHVVSLRAVYTHSPRKPYSLHVTLMPVYAASSPNVQPDGRSGLP